MHMRVFCFWRSECGLANRFHNNNYLHVNTVHEYIYPICKCECSQYVSLKLFRLITIFYFLFNLNKQDRFAAVWLSYTDLFNLCFPLQISCTSYHVLVLFSSSASGVTIGLEILVNLLSCCQKLCNRCVGSLRRLKWTFWLVIARLVQCTPMN